MTIVEELPPSFVLMFVDATQWWKRKAKIETRQTQTDRQTNKQTDKQTNKQTNKQIKKQTNKETKKQTKKQTKNKTNKEWKRKKSWKKIQWLFFKGFIVHSSFYIYKQQYWTNVSTIEYVI